MIFRLLCFVSVMFISFHFLSYCCLLLFCNDDGHDGEDQGFATGAPGPGRRHLMQRFAGGEIFERKW